MSRNRIEQTSITDQVRKILLERIETGALAPGTRILEHTLADELGVSKMPLRVALHQLKQDGIVSVLPRRGIYVSAPTIDEILELIDIRESLEGLAARRAAERRSTQIVKKMRGCFSQFANQPIAENRVAYTIADHRFHKLLVQAADSPELVRMMERIYIRSQMNRLRTAAATSDNDIEKIHAEHLEIINAISRGDPQAAESAVREHIRDVPWTAYITSKESAEIRR